MLQRKTSSVPVRGIEKLFIVEGFAVIGVSSSIN
jgi:hypothetical protein